MEKVTVSAKALKQLLEALNGPGHYIRELQVIRNIDSKMPNPNNRNPINLLMEEYNAAVEAYNNELIEPEEDDTPASQSHTPEYVAALEQALRRVIRDTELHLSDGGSMYTDDPDKYRKILGLPKWSGLEREIVPVT